VQKHATSQYGLCSPKPVILGTGRGKIFTGHRNVVWVVEVGEERLNRVTYTAPRDPAIDRAWDIRYTLQSKWRLVVIFARRETRRKEKMVSGLFKIGCRQFSD
jgi:hypothetical protein